MTSMVQWGMRQSTEVENNMTSVERVIEYENIDPEDEWEAPADQKPPSDWPARGEVSFDKLSLRYFPDPSSNLVLKELEVTIAPLEKIGIVGRTGIFLDIFIYFCEKLFKKRFKFLSRCGKIIINKCTI